MSQIGGRFSITPSKTFRKPFDIRPPKKKIFYGFFLIAAALSEQAHASTADCQSPEIHEQPYGL
jgi:hypothetical protein